ncbi:MAG: CUAEP/CCAEP-tail radical SAM (seleno)protein [Acidobacteriota bacterium]
MRALLLSTYELGRQPFGLASPAAWLRRAGVEVRVCDLARQQLDEPAVREADVIAFHLPMHTATRLALPVLDRVRAANPSARLAAYGLYAPVNGTLLRARGVEGVFGAEFEGDLVRFVTGAADATRHESPGPVRSSPATSGRPPQPRADAIPRLAFIVPDRDGLPSLDRYAALQEGSTRRVAGYTEASRGCKHLCRHCPVVPVYRGQFRIVPPDVVLADIRAQVERGATHVTFGDPDFLNGPAHALRVADAVHREFPALTYDVTIKVEHLVRHSAMLPRLRETGCLFVTSAVEDVNDRILALLEKRHTRADLERAVEACRSAGLALTPTLVPFTPWTTFNGYCGLLQTMAGLDLVESIAPVQWSIRLLIPEGSRLLEVPEVRARVRPFDPTALAYPWTHADPRIDQFQREITALVGRSLIAPPSEVFAQVSALAHERAGLATRPRIPDRGRGARGASVPYLNEPWYC